MLLALGENGDGRWLGRGGSGYGGRAAPWATPWPRVRPGHLDNGQLGSALDVELVFGSPNQLALEFVLLSLGSLLQGEGRLAFHFRSGALRRGIFGLFIIAARHCTAVHDIITALVARNLVWCVAAASAAVTTGARAWATISSCPLAPPALEFDTRILLRSLEGTFKELPVESLVMVTDPRLFPEEGPDPVGPDDPDDDPVLDMDDEVVDPLVFDPADPEEVV